MSVDHDGAVLVALARNKGFAVARVEVGANCAQATALYKQSEDVLLGPVMVSPVGYAFFVNHSGTPEVSRLQVIPMLQHPKDIIESL
jgi:hypothetical protein